MTAIPPSNPFAISSNPFSIPTPASDSSARPAPADTMSEASGDSLFTLGINPFLRQAVTEHGEAGPEGDRDPSDGSGSSISGSNPFGSGKEPAAPLSAELLPHPYLKFLMDPASIKETNNIGSYLVNPSLPFVLDPKEKANGIISAPLLGTDPMKGIMAECKAPFNPLVPSSSAIKLLVDVVSAKHAGKPVAEQIKAFNVIIKQVYRTTLSDENKGLVEVALRRAFTLKLIDEQQQVNRGVTHSLSANRLRFEERDCFTSDFFENIELIHGFSTRMGTFASDLDPVYELTRAVIETKVAKMELENRLYDDIPAQLSLAMSEIQGPMPYAIKNILEKIPNPTHKRYLEEDITALIKGKLIENAVAKAVARVTAVMYDPRKQRSEAFAGLENPNSLASSLLAINAFAEGNAPHILMDLLRKVFGTTSSTGTIFAPEVQGTILKDLLTKPGIKGTILEAVFDEYLI